ncbi:MAG TPA: hypothetical protein VKV39_00230 [Candidatus Sulfotelmatobacter sp.]|nr:hypothetical protein [Candidatus Sulfotelmatobacter sp.]
MYQRGAKSISSFSECLLFLVVSAALMLLSSATTVQAETEEQCQARIAHADHELHEAIEHHGPNSHQADRRRHDLHEARERCWREHHRWWDEHEHRWHDQRDWDDRDHYRD